MEPLSPKMRVALKQVHPGLTDAEIDRYEALLSERMQCDPETEVKRIADLDNERVTLLKDRMPQFNDVVRQIAAEAPPRKPRRAPTVTVKK